MTYSEDLRTATGPTSSVSANLKSGGAIWSWKYGNYEFVNRHDNGRLVQGTFFSRLASPYISVYTGNLVQWNPTQAGSGGGGLEPWYGSLNATATPSGSYLDTSCNPLDFFPCDFNGAPGNAQTQNANPYAYSGVMIGTEVWLEDFDVSDTRYNGLPKVSIYKARYYTPNALNLRTAAYNGGPYCAPSVASSFYLKNSFNAVEPKYWPTTATAPGGYTRYYNASNFGQGFYVGNQSPSGAFSILYADDTNDKAIGLFITKVVNPGLNQLQAFLSTSYSSTADPFANECSVIQLYNDADIPAGFSYMTIYVVVGPVLKVRQAIYNIWWHREMGQTTPYPFDVGA